MGRETAPIGGQSGGLEMAEMTKKQAEHLKRHVSVIARAWELHARKRSRRSERRNYDKENGNK